MNAPLNSFDLDEYARAALRRAGLPVLDYPKPEPSEAAFQKGRESMTVWIYSGLSLGFVFGIAVAALVARVAGVL